MNNVYQNYINIVNEIGNVCEKTGRNPNDIKVIAVSKTQKIDTLINAINSGVPIFGENYAQEFRDKYKQLINSNVELNKCEFHFIGHLQTNKVKYIVPNVSVIHTIDSIGIANEINKYAEKINKTIKILIQINTSQETNKSGIPPEQCTPFTKQLLQLNNLNLIGLMTIGTFSNNENISRKEFSTLAECLKDTNKANGINLKELSMGMSDDFGIAIEEGTTMIRIGTAIFGKRDVL